MTPVATRRKDGIWIDDPSDASRLHAKHGLGSMQSGNRSRLHPIEAAEALRLGRIHMDGTHWTELIEDDALYLAYVDLRERGLQVSLSQDSLTVWARGEKAPAAPWFRCWVHPERASVDPAWFLDRIDDVLAVVDEDGVVTYYHCEGLDLRGQNVVGDGRAQGRILGDRVHVTTVAGLGTGHDEGEWLSLLEACWLADAGRLQIDADLHAAGHAQHEDFDTILDVYKDLRGRGVLAKSGYRFGTHLRGYAGGLDDSHAQWLVDVWPGDRRGSWPHISRGVRLAHGVRKQFVVAAVDQDVRYIGLSWMRP